MNRNSNSSGETSPPPPKRGETVFDDEGWKAFEAAWQEPILRQALAREEWARLGHAQKALAIKAARGYVAWRKSQRKPPNVLNAHSFLRERDAWSRFAELATGYATVPHAQKLAADSDEAKAVELAFRIAGKPIAINSFMRASDGGLYYRGEVAPQLLALNGAPPHGEWPALEYQQTAAWNGFLEKYVTVDAWSRLSAGSKAPWAWPPRKDGTLSTTAPDIGCSEQELADFK